MTDTAADPRGKRRGLTEDGHDVFDTVDDTGRRVTKEATLHDAGLLSDGTPWKLLTEDKE
jgi:hypothetical protein